MLKHEVDTSQHLYELLLQRVKEAAVASAIRASNIIIVDPARRPLRPYKPDIILNSAIGLMGGVFLSLGYRPESLLPNHYHKLDLICFAKYPHVEPPRQ